MATRQELISTLSALTTDYSELISERREADDLYFRESVPQPALIKKSDKNFFSISDCEKIIAGKCILDEENLNKGQIDDDCLNLTYEKLEKIEIDKPKKKEPVKPLGPEYKKGFTRPLLTVFSAVTFLLVIIFGILYVCRINAAVYLFVISIMATLILCVFSNGGIIFLLINLAILPKIKKKRAQEMEKYKGELAKYIQDEQAAQIEYDKALKAYEQQVIVADKEYEEKCRKLHESVLLEIQDYIGICKDYFARKKKAEAEFENKKAIIKTKYQAIAKKIKSYPDTMPPKFLKVPDFEAASCFTLGEIKSELKAYIDILESGRADNLKEATNCYIADKQAEEQRRILEQQAEEARRREEERNRILEEQAQEQRRYNEEQRRFNEQQAEEQRRFNQWQIDDQRRRDEDQRRANEQQAYKQRKQVEEQKKLMQNQMSEQKKLAQMQACATTTCPNCRRQCGMASYNPSGHSGCACFIKK